MNTPLDASKSRSFEGGPSFGLGNRVFRAVWALTWLLLASWSHPFHGWRRFLLRAFGAKIGRGVYIAPTARIWYPPFLELGDFVALGDEVDIYCMAPIKIGKYGIVSKRAHLCAGTHDVNDEYFQLVTKGISLGEQAWIAAECFVGPGVFVGEGAVLGARGVATKNLEPWTIYIGNPAREIKKRPPIVRDDYPARGWKKQHAGL